MNISESLRQRIPSRLKPALRIPLRTYLCIYRRIVLISPLKRFKAAKFMKINDYDDWYYTRPEAKDYRNNEKIWINLVDMVQYFKPNKVFEFGSGLGHVLKETQKRDIDIVGSETSEYAIRNSLCREKIITIGETPKSKLPFKDNSFDLVFSTEVMEHVKEEHTEAVIKEVYRICSDYALLTINTFDYKQPGHVNMHPRNWWLRKFEKEGFRHDNKVWNDLNKMKYLKWDVYVFKKINIIETEKNRER